MKRTFWALALMGALGCGQEGPAGPQGEKGERGEKGDPGGTEANIASVQPTTVFLGRRVTVQIGGNNTHFAQGTKVDFNDPGIRVEKVTVGSPTLLTAQIVIGPQDPTKATGWAQIRPHDITITSDHEGQDEVVTLKGQFNVQPPLEFVTLNAEDKAGGKLMQGGIGRFIITNLDYVQNPFGSTRSPLFGLSFLEDGAAAPLAGTTSQIQARAFINVNAGENPAFIAVSPSPLGDVVAYPLPPGVPQLSPKIEKRAPTALMLGMAASGKVAAKDQTALFKVEASMELKDKDRVYTLTLTKKPDAKIRPTLAVLPDSGKWADQLAAGGGGQLATGMGESTPYFVVVPPATKLLYPIVFDAQLNGAEMGYEFGVTASEQAVNIVSMYMAGTKPDMPNKQIDLTKGATYVKESKLASHSELNYFEFTAPKAGKIYVVTTPNDPTMDKTDLMLNVLEGDCKTGRSLMPGGRPLDDDYFDSFSFGAKAMQAYCIVVQDSDFPFYAQMGGPYRLLIVPAE